jgi:hypothetical protein
MIVKNIMTIISSIKSVLRIFFTQQSPQRIFFCFTDKHTTFTP